MSTPNQETPFQKFINFLLKHLRITARAIQNALQWRNQNLEWHQVISVWLYALIPFWLPIMFTLAFSASAKLSEGWIITIDITAALLMSWLFGLAMFTAGVSNENHSK